MSLVTIPLDIINIITSYLHWEDTANLFRVCRRFINKEYWLKLKKEEFPYDNTEHFYESNFYNYLACRARYLIARCHVLKEVRWRISKDLRLYIKSDKNIFTTYEKFGDIAQQLTLIQKICNFAPINNMDWKGIQNSLIIDKDLNIIREYLELINTSPYKEIQEKLYKRDLDELVKLTKVLICKLDKLHPNSFDVVRSNGSENIIDPKPYNLIFNGKGDSFKIYFFDKEVYYEAKDKSYGFYKFPKEFELFFQRLGFSCNSVLLLYELQGISIRIDAKINWEQIKKFIYPLEELVPRPGREELTENIDVMMTTIK